MRQTAKALLVGSVVAVAPALAHAHVSIISGPGFLNVTQEVTFGVGHGCSGADTYRVQVEIPAGIGSIRPLTSGFGKTSLETDSAGNVTSVTWQKADADALPGDTEYYKLTVRMRIGISGPFETVYFPVHQTCRDKNGALLVTHWVGKPGDPPPPGDAGEDEPAATLQVLPARVAGWNKFTVPVAVSDLSVFFKDALIVWKGNAAYSANPSTLELIKTTEGVTALASLQANDEIWVKY
jgi:periplasmic copper chaperone A